MCTITLFLFKAPPPPPTMFCKCVILPLNYKAIKTCRVTHQFYSKFAQRNKFRASISDSLKPLHLNKSNMLLKLHTKLPIIIYTKKKVNIICAIYVSNDARNSKHMASNFIIHVLVQDLRKLHMYKIHNFYCMTSLHTMLHLN